MKLDASRPSASEDLRSTLRIEQSRHELDRLGAAFGAWIARRTAADRRRQYQTQLDSLRTVVERALGAVRAELDDVSPHQSCGEVYARCSRNDQRALLVHRLWEFYREKWDQRDHRQLRAVLAAADEVVWSCWAGPARSTGRRRAPAPLPYVEPRYSAHASVRLRPPQQLRTADDLLGAMLAKLPIPLTGIPPICVERPWWLVVLAHETGHHVAFDLLDEPITGRIRGVVAGSADDASGAIWPDWTHELFADAFGIACTGGGHRWAIDELELASDEQMVADAGPYPPALVRGAFNRALLTALGGDEAPAVEALPERLRRLGASVRPVADALVDTPLDDGGHSLRVLTGWEAEHFATEGDVACWSAQLLSARDVVPVASLGAARLAVAGAVTAWESIAAQAEATETQREERRERLRARTLALVAGCREEGTRRADEAAADAAEAADEVARLLLETDWES